MHLKIGSRGSKLALIQTNMFIERLKSFLDFTYEIVVIKTTGDQIQDKPLYEIGGKALFLKELEVALLEKKIDIAVHSLKDVPGEVDSNFYISAYINDHLPRDVIISKKYKNIHELEDGAVIGTCAPRRIAFLNKLNPNLNIQPLRGNINSRLQKLKDGLYDAIILAEAGLKRWGIYDDALCSPIDMHDFIPAVGQGVICAEILSNNNHLAKYLDLVNDSSSVKNTLIEREFLRKVSADCKTPVAGHITNINGKMHFLTMLADDDFHNASTSIDEVDYHDENFTDKIIAKLKAKLSSNY